MKKLFSLLTLALLTVSAWAGTSVTFDFTTGYVNQAELTTLQQDGVTLTFNKGTNNNPTRWYENGASARMYGGNTLNIASNGDNITEVIFTFTGTSNTMNSTATCSVDAGTYVEDGTTGTWTGNAQNFTITRGGTTGHARIASIQVVMGGEVVITVADPVFTPADGAMFTDEQEISLSCSTGDATIYYSTDGLVWNVYTEPFTITETTTVYAKATLGEVESNVVTATYTKSEAPAGEAIVFKSSEDQGNGSTTRAEWTVVKDGITLNCSDGTVYTDNYRIYSGATLTISSTVGNITMIEFVNTDSSRPISNLTAQAGTLTINGAAGTWVGEAASVAFTASAQTRASEIHVYVDGSSTPIITVAAPTLPEAQTFEESLTVAITNNEDGATLYYSTDGLVWNVYTEALTLTETTTVYAKATKDGIDSQIVSATYTKVEPANEITTLAQANGLEDGTDFMFKGDAVVTYHNGKYLFLRDASGYGLIYYDAAPAETFANGAVLNQDWTATKTTYRSLVEYQNPANVTASGVSNSALAAVQEIEASQMADMINAYVKINHVKSISGTTATLTDGTTIALYNRFTGVTIPEFTDQDCSITGIVSIYNDALQLYFIESDYNSSVEPPVEGTTYQLVTDATELNDGDKIILVNNEAAKALGAARTSNFGAVDVEINDNIIVTEDANVITLEAQGDNWALKANEGYLYAASSSANQLKAKAEVDSNAIAAITIDDAASIIFQGSNSRNNLRYNKGSILFSCYASGQEPVYIYKATTEVPPVVEVAAPVLDPIHNTKFVDSQEVTITCATEGATIYYTTDSVYQVYEAPFTITETTTVKAYAELNGNTSSTVSAKYIKLVEVDNIVAANALDNKVDFIFNGDAVVTYQNGKNLWIRDASGSGLIYGSQVPEIAQGTVLKEGWIAQKYDFRGGLVPEFQYPTGVEASENVVTVEPFERATLALENVNEYVIMKNQTITAETDETVSNYQKYFYNADSLVLYNQFDIEFTLEEGKTYDVVGTVTVYNEKPQLYIISVTEHVGETYLRGDVDMDGIIGISDVTRLVDYILSKDATGMSTEAADTDLDGEIGIADVTKLVDYILSKTWD